MSDFGLTSSRCLLLFILSSLIALGCSKQSANPSTPSATTKTSSEGNKAEHTSARYPNILFILTDDQRRDTISAHGNKEIVTPNLDELAARGVSFNQAAIMGAMNGAVCAPSRAMIMTGRSVFEIEPSGTQIDVQHKTLPESLLKHGYTTFHTGKWHNGKSAFARSFSMGKNIFFGGMSDHYEVPIQDFDKSGQYSSERARTARRNHSTLLYSETAQDFLRSYQSEKPFFLSLAFQAPHDPRQIDASERHGYQSGSLSIGDSFLEQHPFDNGELDVRDEWTAGNPREPTEVKQHIAAYYEMITQIDREIGKILSTLEKTGKADNTLIIFTSDNGLSLGRHGLMGKQSVYEHSVGVPLIFSGLNLPQGATTNYPVYLSDIYPTLFDLLGLKPNKSVTGTSFLQALSSPNESELNDSLPVRVHAYKNFQRALVDWPYKLIAYNVGDEPRYQLFNLVEDPEETTDLFSTPASGELERLKAQLILRMQTELRVQSDKANLSQPQWALPRIDSWVDYMRANEPDQLINLRNMAEQERQQFEF